MWELKTLLFLPVIRWHPISTLELMVAEDYMIVYLNGATPRRKMPGLGWMKKCYQMIDKTVCGAPLANHYFDFLNNSHLQ